jgi:hypothetical protein
MSVMAPFMIWDLMKLTNRIAGPLYRFEALLREFSINGTLKPAVLRDGDLLVDFQTQFNQFAEKLHALYPETKPRVAPAEGCSTQDSTATVQSDSGLPLRIIG